MTQIFVFGASYAYGVGGSDGGWADMLKRHLHRVMYSANGIGEKHELYNFSKPGVTAQFVQETFPAQLNHYRNPGKVIAILSVGLNNAKAINTPNNFASSLEEFQVSTHRLLTDLKTQVGEVITLGYCPHDERKTLPKRNPLTGGQSYFWNARTKTFEEKLKRSCNQTDTLFVGIQRPIDEWINDCLYPDGLHPNDEGHKVIFETLLPHIKL